MIETFTLGIGIPVCVIVAAMLTFAVVKWYMEREEN